MRFQPVQRTLKNNKTVTIREAEPADAARLLNAIHAYVHESEYLLTTPAEFDMTEEKEREWIESFTQRESSLLVIAEYENQIVGSIDLTGGRRNRIRHTSLIGIGMLAAWQGVGLGTVLFECIIDWARWHSPIELLWLEVVGANEKALALYQKMGFTETGRQQRYFRLTETRYEDNVIMSLWLEK
jgi:RimJ/RimL family protein N-acetyltransferase